MASNWFAGVRPREECGRGRGRFRAWWIGLAEFDCGRWNRGPKIWRLLLHQSPAWMPGSDQSGSALHSAVPTPRPGHCGSLPEGGERHTEPRRVAEKAVKVLVDVAAESPGDSKKDKKSRGKSQTRNATRNYYICLDLSRAETPRHSCSQPCTPLSLRRAACSLECLSQFHIPLL